MQCMGHAGRGRGSLPGGTPPDPQGRLRRVMGCQTEELRSADNWLDQFGLRFSNRGGGRTLPDDVYRQWSCFFEEHEANCPLTLLYKGPTYQLLVLQETPFWFSENRQTPEIRAADPGGLGACPQKSSPSNNVLPFIPAEKKRKAQ
jgi:hypothetical protein